MSGSLDVPSFDSEAPFGAYLPAPLAQRWIGICRSLPAVAPFRQLALWMRRPLKYGLQRPVDVQLWGLKLRLVPRGNISESRLLFVPQFFDRVEREALRSFLAPGCVFVDVGANAGAYSFWVYSLLRNQCEIYAVEPDLELVRRIEFNKQTNGAANLHVFPWALSSARGVGALHLCRENKGRNHLACDDEPDLQPDAVPVRVNTLLELAIEAGIKQIDALKIDVEGHERPILEHFFAHAPAQLWPRMIICETGASPEQASLRRLLLAEMYVEGAKTQLNQVFYLGTAHTRRAAISA